MQQPLFSNGFTNKHVFKAAIRNSNTGTVFSVWSMPTCYKRDSWSNERVVRQSQAGKNANMEAEYIVGIHHQATTGEDRLRRLSTCCNEL
jgi:hypothetical protein